MDKRGIKGLKTRMGRKCCISRGKKLGQSRGKAPGVKAAKSFECKGE